MFPYLLFIQNYAVEHCGTRHNGLHNIGSPDQLFINNIIYHLHCSIFTSPMHQNPSMSTIHFRMFLYLVTCFLRATVSLQCRLQAVSNIHVPIYPYLICEGRPNCSSLWLAQQRNHDSHAGNMLPNTNTCKNGWSNFSDNLCIVAIKLL